MKIERNLTTQKNFSYKSDDIALSFSLNTDNKDSLERFKELLEIALKDVRETINPTVNKHE